MAAKRKAGTSAAGRGRRVTARAPSEVRGIGWARGGRVRERGLRRRRGDRGDRRDRLGRGFSAGEDATRAWDQ